MDYKSLIGDEVYWGTPNKEVFHVISNIVEEGDFVNIFWDDEKSTKIHKEDLNFFLENDEVLYQRQTPQGLVVESLVACGLVYERSWEIY